MSDTTFERIIEPYIWAIMQGNKKQIEKLQPNMEIIALIHTELIYEAISMLEIEKAYTMRVYTLQEMNNVEEAIKKLERLL